MNAGNSAEGIGAAAQSAISPYVSCVQYWICCSWQQLDSGVSSSEHAINFIYVQFRLCTLETMLGRSLRLTASYCCFFTETIDHSSRHVGSASIL